LVVCCQGLGLILKHIELLNFWSLMKEIKKLIAHFMHTRHF
jgi:hypothetical protein